MDDLHQQRMGATENVAAAFVSKNTIPVNDLPDLIRGIYRTFKELDEAAAAAAQPAEIVMAPSVPIKKSVAHDHVTCLECGAKAKMLKRHLQVEHGLDEGAYKARWGLAKDHPLTAPAYSERRRELAVKIGLGRKPGTKVLGKRKVA